MAIVTVYLPHHPETSKVAREGRALIIGPNGINQMRVLAAEELALFADDDDKAEFDAEMISGEWQLMRRVGTN
jgi:hypothetical protein